MPFRDTPLIFLPKKTWEYSKGNRAQVVLYFVLFAIANIIMLAETLVIAWLLNTIQRQGVHAENLRFIIALLLLIIAVNIGFWVFHGPARVIETRNAFIVRAQYQQYLIDGVMALPVEWHTDHHSGDTIDKIEKGTKALYQFSSDSFMVIEAVVRLVGSGVALAYFHPPSLFIVFGLVFITAFVILGFDKILVPQYEKLFRAENGIAEKVYDTISNITTVIILRVEGLISKTIVKKIFAPLPLFVKNSKINEWKWFLVTMCSTGMIVLVLFSYMYQTVSVGGVVAIGIIYALYGYVQKISDLFYRFAFMYSDIVQQKTAVMNAEELTQEFKNKKTVKQVSLRREWRALSVKNLRFSYHKEDGADLHLDGISFSIQNGERIALIGASGSGKTTLLKILRGLYKPNHIELFLDDAPLKHGFESISSEIALIPQDPEIFATTIKENITIGVDHTIKKITRYTDMARFTDVVSRLPKKFDSSIVEKGVNLSGGEKQRLALARGLLASEDKSIVLLDEPTSSVDSRNELAIYKNIFQTFEDKVIVSSIHRLHLLSLFDTIYFFDKGKIIASGSLEYLLQTSMEFQELWKKYHSKVKRRIL
ncbi:MAG: hypothetical protein A3G08_02365 [Candidatus Magasanikbacteria bacterium RIFCSPLOWO2_12_FULL_47_9b]|nr:MAG: hypothetical protein A3I74_02545 [Candidatus Magasanikbacteria bacterium RIFCSPLOWO2_02_FULL_47_16]OGH79615.1 MAG: hypothetical protein A3C10_00855 [Candidatus Magasanikbacteria bacterium RIFCSPHIGHO2_02_FULL_48_18]OGH82031.1 MAG: hypothetical protein A3G08_02365 [Candidatus Magasanikbacteria bacterium RIFCSPLOWO2_12_FULL_47_9b]